MNKRIRNLILTAVIVVGLIVCAIPAFATPNSNSGVSASKTQVAPGEKIEVSFTIPPLTELAADITVVVEFDKTAFKLTSYEAPDIAGTDKMQCTVEEGNNAGAFTAVYNTSSAEADLDLSEGFVLKAELEVLAGAADGDYKFKIENTTSVNGLTEDGLTLVIMEAGDGTFTEEVTVKVQSVKETPAPATPTPATPTPATPTPATPTPATPTPATPTPTPATPTPATPTPATPTPATPTPATPTPEPEIPTPAPVTPTPSGSDNEPVVGDSSELILWFALILGSLTAISVLSMYLHKKKHAE